MVAIQNFENLKNNNVLLGLFLNVVIKNYNDKAVISSFFTKNNRILSDDFLDFVFSINTSKISICITYNSSVHQNLDCNKERVDSNLEITVLDIFCFSNIFLTNF